MDKLILLDTKKSMHYDKKEILKCLTNFIFAIANKEKKHSGFGIYLYIWYIYSNPMVLWEASIILKKGLGAKCLTNFIYKYFSLKSNN